MVRLKVGGVAIGQNQSDATLVVLAGVWPRALAEWWLGCIAGSGLLSLGVIGSPMVQFRLYHPVNPLVPATGQVASFMSWWLLVPGFTIILGLQSMLHFRFRGFVNRGLAIAAPITKAFPALFVASLVLLLGCVVLSPSAQAAPLTQPSLLAAGSLFSFAGDRPTGLGVQTGALGACPQSPNCVSTQSSDKQHRIEPLQFDGPLDTAIAQLKDIIEGLPRAKVIEVTDDYLYAEFTSSLMGFVDDVEFYLDPTEPVIQARSASRLGESDMGVNRKRIETIRKKLNGFNLPG